LISSLPQPKHETLEKDAAIKAIKNAGLSSTGLSVAKDEPLGIAQNANVVVDSAEYVLMICGSMRKADSSIAPSLAYTLRTASSLARARTRLFLVSTQACNCTSLELAMLCATRSCRPVVDTNGYDNYPTSLLNSRAKEIVHLLVFSFSLSIMSTQTRRIRSQDVRISRNIASTGGSKFQHYLTN
jgi:hypothetical protein